MPVYIVAGPGGGGQVPGVVGDMINAAGVPLADQAGNAVDAVFGVGNRPLPTDPVQLGRLFQERNPMALAAAMGYQVGDYSRQGGGLDAQNLFTGGPKTQADGRIFSDTASLVDRTFSSLQAVLQAQHEQMLDVTSQVRDHLTEKLLKPVLQDGVTSGVDAISTATSSAIGQSMGQAAAPPIADAVRAAIPAAAPAATTGGVPHGGGGLPGPPGMATGGAIWGGIPGKDSVPILGMPGEHMLTVPDVAALGGQAGVYAFRDALHRNGGLHRMATGGGVSTNDVVGAEFFGVSQIPIISTIVNVLVSILLRLVGIELEARDTLQEITGEVRQFRGEFAPFDAMGRLMSDTSALVERTQSSEKTAVDERVRILKLVISETIKWIIKQFVIPITEAVANTAIQAGASAAGMALNTQAPGAGSIVSSLISSGGQAAVGIGMDVWRGAVDAITPVATDLVGDLIERVFPGLVNGLFSGRWLANLFTPRIGGLSGGLAGLFAGLAGVADMTFDSGGVATGKGVLLKNTIHPERVLSPSQTEALEDLPGALREFARSNGGGKQLTVHLTQEIYGGPAAADDAADSIMKLVGR
ncbi:Uncharacterised protein [Mycolicibacterium vanbaalenii]|uniref:Uncharacterized protein n=1 Tax=Mycolicibacterium vanbaalenii TaxID=110539 RepID=A0A5S9MNX0_MYCVN|nr:Uncharacterised protein [Mycolicibacterium vanbaalenii]